MILLVTSESSDISRAVVREETAQIFTYEDTEIYLLVNDVIVNFGICLFGIITNIMNIIVFLKQGFDNTINISFFGLAISDMLSLVFLMWYCFGLNLLVAKADIPVLPIDLIHLTGGIPHITFVRITGWITVFITAERCLCITMPLKIKRIITPRVTAIYICFIYISIILSFLPEYQTSYYAWVFYPEKNRTLLSLAFTENRKSMEGVVFFLFAVLGKASFVAVVVFTVLLVVQLKRKSKWRKQSYIDKTRAENITSRDRKTMTMVVMIATVLIICYIPGVVISLVSFLIPGFCFNGGQWYAFFVTWSFAFIFESINSSVNIFVYYKMSTKYRETFVEIFGVKKKVIS